LLTKLADHQAIGIRQPISVRDELRAIDTDDEFIRSMIGADYKTHVISVETALKRMTSDYNAFAALIAYLWGSNKVGEDESVIAIELRQALKDPQLALTWKGGRRNSEGDAASLSALRNWERLRHLDWNDEQKRTFLLAAYADVADRLRDISTKSVRLSA
jgi:hypothetical protein